MVSLLGIPSQENTGIVFNLYLKQDTFLKDKNIYIYIAFPFFHITDMKYLFFNLEPIIQIYGFYMQLQKKVGIDVAITRSYHISMGGGGNLKIFATGNVLILK